MEQTGHAAKRLAITFTTCCRILKDATATKAAQLPLQEAHHEPLQALRSIAAHGVPATPLEFVSDCKKHVAPLQTCLPFAAASFAGMNLEISDKVQAASPEVRKGRQWQGCPMGARDPSNCASAPLPILPCLPTAGGAWWP